MNRFQKQCPGIFLVLSRFLSADNMRVISGDYEVAESLNGNYEPKLRREQGVSFNPRLARILLIVAREAGLQDTVLLRATLYSALHQATDEVLEWVPVELQLLVSNVRDALYQDAAVSNIRAAITLDAIRHLHMTEYSSEEKERFLKTWKSSPLMEVASLVQPDLRLKLVSAVQMQERRFELEKSEQK